MLTEVVGAEELLRLIAFTELVYVGEMLATGVPIGRGIVWKLFAAVSASIERRHRVQRRCRLTRAVFGRRDGGRRVEGGVVLTAKDRTRPGMLAKVERILMSFGFVFVLEAVVTV